MAHCLRRAGGWQAGPSPWDTPRLCGEGSTCRGGEASPQGLAGTLHLPQPPSLPAKWRQRPPASSQGGPAEPSSGGPAVWGQLGLCRPKPCWSCILPGGELPSEGGGGLCIGARPQLSRAVPSPGGGLSRRLPGPWVRTLGVRSLHVPGPSLANAQTQPCFQSQVPTFQTLCRT